MVHEADLEDREELRTTNEPHATITPLMFRNSNKTAQAPHALCIQRPRRRCHKRYLVGCRSAPQLGP